MTDSNNAQPVAENIGFIDRLARVGVPEKAEVYEATRDALEKLSNTADQDVKGIAASQIELLTRFYDLLFSQAQRSFRWALIASCVGLVFLMFATLSASNSGDVLTTMPIVSGISGILIEFIAAINFYLYGKTIRQLNLYQGRLEVTQRFLLANSLIESLSPELQDKSRAEIITKLVETRPQAYRESLEKKT